MENGWARESASTFATRLQDVFHSSTSSLVLPALTKIEFRPNEIAKLITNQVKPKKSPEVIIELPYCAVCTIILSFGNVTPTNVSQAS